MPEKSDGGAWAVIRYLSCHSTQVRANFRLTYGSFNNRDAAEAVAKDWVSEYPEATVVVVGQPNRFLATGGEQQTRLFRGRRDPV